MRGLTDTKAGTNPQHGKLQICICREQKGVRKRNLYVLHIIAVVLTNKMGHDMGIVQTDGQMDRQAVKTTKCVIGCVCYSGRVFPLRGQQSVL